MMSTGINVDRNVDAEDDELRALPGCDDMLSMALSMSMSWQ